PKKTSQPLWSLKPGSNPVCAYSATCDLFPGARLKAALFSLSVQRVGERAEQVSTLTAVAARALLDAANRSQHPHALRRVRGEQVLPAAQFFQSGRLEAVQRARRRPAQQIHARQVRRDVDHRSLVQKQTHQLQSPDTPHFLLARHAAEPMRLEAGDMAAVPDIP